VKDYAQRHSTDSKEVKRRKKIIFWFLLLAIYTFILSLIFVKIGVKEIQEIYIPNPPKIIKVEVKAYRVWRGTASYYSRAGCLGCKYRMGKSGWNLYMHNGEVLDDTKLTVAFNWLPLNSMVRVTNRDTGIHINAKVTDTGGFNRLGRIIDLGLATKIAINCRDLCQVKVEKI